ncbi:MAG: ABC transporter substrate-binding protein [Micromonosporaceae bacterium]
MRVQKAWVAAVVALAAALAVAGCGGDSGGRQSVTMWIYPVIAEETPHRDYWDDTVKAFKKQNPNIDVKVEIFPWADRDQALATAIAGNKGPDVVYLIPDQLPMYERNIEPVDEYLDSKTKQDYLPNVREAVTSDGKMLGAPVLTSAMALTCNKKVFDAVGQKEYPATWDDLLTMAPKFKAKGYDVAMYPGDLKETLNMTFYPLLWQAGGDVFSKDGKSVAFDGAEGRKALKFVRTMVDKGYVDKGMLTSSPPVEQTRMAQGKVGCVWHYPVPELTTLWGEENVTVLPPLKETKQIQYGTVGALSMLKGAEDKEAAGKWIAFASNPENTKKYDLAAGFFSPYESTGKLYADDPVLGELEKYTAMTTVGPLHEKARDVMGVLAPELQAALLGKKSDAQALSDAAKAADELLA